MIIQYSDFVKNKLTKWFGSHGYSVETYNKYYTSGLTSIIPIIKYFAETVNGDFIDQLFHKLFEPTVSIEKLVSRGEIEVIIYSSETEFKLANAKGFIVYTKTTHSVTKEEKIYLLLLCVNKSYRKYGYGKVFMEEFIELVKNSNSKSKRVILHSLDTSLQFYKSFGFTEIPDKITNYKKLFKYEKYDKQTVLLEYSIEPN
jgi:N-acetylglutamate synthase-like GNAT family acetyltransferase